MAERLKYTRYTTFLNFRLPVNYAAALRRYCAMNKVSIVERFEELLDKFIQNPEEIISRRGLPLITPASSESVKMTIRTTEDMQKYIYHFAQMNRMPVSKVLQLIVERDTLIESRL